MTVDETGETSLTIQRSFDASPERVFDAWLDPETARKWLFTTPSSESTRVEIDAQVGGTYTIADRRDGEDYTAVGEYLEIDRPHRLIFTFAMPQFSSDIDHITVEIEPDGDGCTLTFTEEGMPPEHLSEAEEGYREMFDALADHLETED